MATPRLSTVSSVSSSASHSPQSSLKKKVNTIYAHSSHSKNAPTIMLSSLTQSPHPFLGKKKATTDPSLVINARVGYHRYRNEGSLCRGSRAIKLKGILFRAWVKKATTDPSLVINPRVGYHRYRNEGSLCRGSRAIKLKGFLFGAWIRLACFTSSQEEFRHSAGDEAQAVERWTCLLLTQV